MSDTEQPAASVAWLVDVLQSRSEDGDYQFSEQELHDFLAAVLLGASADLGPLPVEVVGIMEGFCARADLSTGQSPTEVRDRVERYFEANPLNSKLLFAYHSGSRDALLTQNTFSMDTKTLGRIGANATVLISGRTEPAPPGSVRGGPLAGFLSHAKISDSD